MEIYTQPIYPRLTWEQLFKDMYIGDNVLKDKRLISDLIIGISKLDSWLAGDYIIGADEDEETGTSASYVKVKEFKVGNDGTVRLTAQYRGGSINSAVQIRFYKNGVAQGNEAASNDTTSYVEFTQDISGVVSGDLLQLYVKNSANTYKVQKFTIEVATPFLSGFDRESL